MRVPHDDWGRDSGDGDGDDAGDMCAGDIVAAVDDDDEHEDEDADDDQDEDEDEDEDGKGN